MKTTYLFIAFVLCGWLLTACGVKRTPDLPVSEGVQGGALIKLNDCEFQNEDSNSKYAVECGVLTALLDQEVKKQEILGMVMAVRLADGSVIWGTSGYTDPSGKERWSANTVSFLASVTKAFTAVVVMQLVEEGKLSLDNTVNTWFPDQPDGDKITIRMLLSHTSGLAGFSTAWGTDLDKWSKDWTPEELITEANTVGLYNKPGSPWAHYSNTNFIMLGRIIEKVTANSWEHEVESRIVQPLGLKSTTCRQDSNLIGKVVPGYLKKSDGYQNILEDPWYTQVSPSVAWAAGGIISSVSDLMTFASALFDGRLVSKETLELMAQPVGTGEGGAWGLGGMVDEVAGHKTFGMSGGTPGYHAFFIGTLDGKVIVTVLINSDGVVIPPSMAALQQYISRQK